MLRIGLSGGIGSGKSTVAAMFAEHGVPVIDADAIALQLTLPGTPTTATLLQSFGPGIADNSGGIDRKALAHRVFSNDPDRALLENILHPLIRTEMLRVQGELNAPYCLLMIPLLVETGQRDLVDRVLMIDVEEYTQIARVAVRDGRTESEIQAILVAQADRTQHLKVADDIINNTGDLDALKVQVDALHRKYLSLIQDSANNR